MRIANLSGRAVALVDNGAIDLHRATSGRFGPDPQSLYERWDELRDWSVSGEPEPYKESDLGPPVPAPRQVFAIGINYRDHAAEADVDVDVDVSQRAPYPPTFTKFPSCLTGPHAEVCLPEGLVDWEVELVVVIGRRAHRVTVDDAWSHVAGLTVGQDLSERLTQLSGPAPQQYCLGKSYPGFGPTGPAVVTVDELGDPDDLPINCEVNGESMQDARTSEMIFRVPELIERLSSVSPLLPGDLIFTGTPAGIGGTRTPPQFLAPGDELVSRIAGIGALHTTFKGA
ncbi:fumarylacetoacetate hydrolase family protein [Streptomyces sp. NPDC006285]|uniref:fumarylacetoacetate hydrolase family protein n=1 Tax=Streptomyces sp. NPDC006285 TaxID=3364742 RepID=UPI00369B8347